MHILCLADIHGCGEKLAALFEKKELFTGIDLVVLAGDITHFGSYAEAEKVLKPALRSGFPILAIPGNCDKPGVAEYLTAQGINLHARGLVIGDTGFMGVGGCNTTPLNTPTEYTEAEITLFLEKGFAVIAACRQKVLISHAPPNNTKLDIINSGQHIGSKAVREFILDKKIDVCLCAHVHEAAGLDILGTTQCLNNGAFREGKYNILEIANNSLTIMRSE